MDLKQRVAAKYLRSALITNDLLQTRESTQQDAGPNDEERGHALVPMRASLARSSSSVSSSLDILKCEGIKWSYRKKNS